MSFAITKCPKCETSFRITAAHLKSAKGAVRCGSCLNIFNAKDYLIEEKKAASISKPARPQKKTFNKASELLKSRGIDADEMISDDENFGDKVTLEFSDGLSDSEEFVYEEKEVKQETNLFERSQKEKEDKESHEDFDETWADELLKDNDDNFDFSSDTEEEIDTCFEARSRKFRQEQQTKKNSKLFEAKEKTSSKKSVSSPFGAGIFRIVDEDPDHGGNTIANQRHPKRPVRATRQYEPIVKEADMPTQAAEKIHYDDYALDYGDEDFDDVVGEKRYASTIEPEPVEFSYVRNHWLWSNQKFMVALVLFALFLAIIQYAWIRFDDLSKAKPWRGFYGSACQLFGCELPALIDRQKINANNLVVRSHPDKKNILIVDTVLQNNASFPQSFPHLDLIFLNTNNKPVAARRLEPDNYLGGELTGAKKMEPKQPIRVGVEIIDPGSEAISYTISIAK